MIVFDLMCADGHRFEGWFGSSGDFTDQCERGLVSCPSCGTSDVCKAPMAPSVPRKGNRIAAAKPQEAAESPVMSNDKLPPQVTEALKKIAEFQSEAIKSSEWVGDKFAEESRAIHYGERKEKAIHGKATAKEAEALAEEGIAVAPLLIPIAPPDEVN